MGSKYIDVTAVMQVIGCVFNDISILDDTDKYTIHEEDFTEDFHKILFGSIYNIYATNSKVTLESIVDYLAVRPKHEAIFKQNKGIEYLQKVSTYAQRETFNYYYNRLKKMTLLRAYDNYGIDVSDLYDPDNLLDAEKKQKQEDWLDNTSVVDIANCIDSRIEEIKSKFVDNDFGEGYQAADGVIELIESLEETPEVGIPMYGRLINTVTRGARLRKFYLRSAATGLGKAIPNNTLIPTPRGWRYVKDILPGDYLFGQDGKPTKVKAIYPQSTKKQVWEVEFADGKIARCCEDHLWEYRYESHRGYAYRVESIKDLYERTKVLKNGLKDAAGRGYRFAVRKNEAVQYPEKQYSVSPYAMGLALGDGSFRYNNSQKSFSFSSETSELPDAFAKEIGAVAIKNSELNYNWRFKFNKEDNHNIWTEELFKNYPELWQAKSEDKFIPRDYLEGSIEQRMALFQGLMDTDGSIDSSGKGRTSFTTISPILRDNIIELCNSLGFTTSYLIDSRNNKYTTGECYVIQIQCKKALKPKLFRLERKVQLAEVYANNGKREEHKDHSAIADIRITNEFEDMTCFTVDNEDHLFLMNDFIVTHNTRALIADACNFACDEIYDEQFGWIKNGTREPTLFIATEQDKSEVQTMMLAFLSCVNEEHILNGTYTDGERDRVIKAAGVLKRANLWIEEMPDFSVQDIEDKIKKYIREHDVKYVCYDYLHTSMKILEEVTRRSGGVKLREDNILFILSTKLKDLCNQYGIFIISATQLNSSYLDSEEPDQNLLRGAKSIADRLDFGAIMLGVSDKDLVKLQPILDSGRFATPNMKISVYKNRRGRWKGIYLWCNADLGTCRIQPMFCTNYRFEMQSIEDIRILVAEDPEGAW